MPTKRKPATTKASTAVKKKPSLSRPKVENLMTEDVSLPTTVSTKTSRKPSSRKKQSKGFVETVKDDFNSAAKAVGKFVEKVGLEVPPPKKRNTKANIVPPFTSPI
jgi:hypothetical protein